MYEKRISRVRGPAIWVGLLALVWPLLLATAARADDATPRVNVTVEVQRELTETGPDGKPATRREPVKAAGPGDVLVYTLRAENVGAAPALNARLRDEIPRGTVLLTESVPDLRTQVLASLDGGSTWSAFPVLVERRLDSGDTERVPAPAETYTHLQWVLNGQLDPGDGRQVEFKVRIQ